MVEQLALLLRFQKFPVRFQIHSSVGCTGLRVVYFSSFMKFPWKKGNANRIKEKEARNIFRRVFLSKDGQEVLRILLNDWCFFDVCKTEQQRVLNDYAKVFLHDYLGLNGITVYTEPDDEKIEAEE